ncbi:MAG: hypothetical protein Q7O66_23375 [Dehalococcoidia bacterium]|nr:hypothetical protein [Dehalococcoidia bacterium]
MATLHRLLALWLQPRKALHTMYLKHTPASGEKSCSGDKLTEREQDVLWLIAEGLLNRDIRGLHLHTRLSPDVPESDPPADRL